MLLHADSEAHGRRTFGGLQEPSPQEAADRVQFPAEALANPGVSSHHLAGWSETGLALTRKGADDRTDRPDHPD